MCAKQRTRVKEPWKPSRRSPSSVTRVLLLEALSAVKPRIYYANSATSNNKQRRNKPCPEYHICEDTRICERLDISLCVLCMPWNDNLLAAGGNKEQISNKTYFTKSKMME